MSHPSSQAPSPSRGLDRALWATQGLLALTFAGTGLWKLLTPVPELAAKMPWMGEVEPGFLYLTAALDLLVGLGVLLPGLTRIQPRLVAPAGFGGVGLMAGAVVFHLQRGEGASTPFNFVMAALCGFVAWGRRPRA